MYGAPTYRQLALVATLVLLGFALPHLVPQYYLYIGNMLITYAVLALGFDILFGWSGQFAFAHAAFFGIGIYGTALLQLRLNMPFWIGMPTASLVAGIIGYLIALPATRLRAVYLALATLAFAECAQWVFRSWTSVTHGADGLKIPAQSIFGYTLDTDAKAFPLMALLLTLVVVATMYLAKSKFARDLAAIRESEHLALASGIDAAKVKVWAFTISAVYAGIAGGMYTLYQSFVNPDLFDVTLLVLLLSMLVVGGSGTIAGVLLGVLLMGVLPEALKSAPMGLLVWQEFATGIIIMLAVMFMPHGIWGLIRNRVQQKKSAAAKNRSRAAPPIAADGEPA